jgi:hypothetical protein
MTVKRNDAGVNYAKRLIRDGKVVMDSDWSKAQPSAGKESEYIDENDWNRYARWFLAVDTDEDETNKERYKFPYGDFSKVHRKGLIAAKQRAAQNDYTDVEKAADVLLDLVDRHAGKDKERD